MDEFDFVDEHPGLFSLLALGLIFGGRGDAPRQPVSPRGLVIVTVVFLAMVVAGSLLPDEDAAYWRWQKAEEARITAACGPSPGSSTEEYWDVWLPCVEAHPPAG